MEIDKSEDFEVEVEVTSLPVEPEREEEKKEPIGAFAFVIIMGIFYVGYWIFAWIEIFATRGA